MEDVEKKLYGDTLTDAALLPMADFVNFMSTWYRVKITDNGDGTWTATADRDGFIFVDGFDEFLINNCNALYISEDEYILSDTMDVSDVQQISILVNSDGTWIASTSNDNVIVTISPGLVEIRNANITYINATTYEITDTFDS